MVKQKNGQLILLSERLDFILRTKGGRSQQYIAEKSGVNQALVSRALNRQLVRETQRVVKLIQVVSHIYADLMRRTEATPKTVAEVVEQYLAAGGDPGLLVEQVDVLRRAAHPPRHAEQSK